MKHIIIFAFTFFAAGASFGQSGSAKQVKWTFTSKKLSENLYEVRMSAVINGDYHLYAPNQVTEGPISTTFKFTPNPLVAMDGKLKESGKLIKKYESAWPGDVTYYEKKVEFIQQVKLKGKVKTSVAGNIEFMVCDDSQCLPPSQVDFKIAVGG